MDRTVEICVISMTNRGSCSKTVPYTDKETLRKDIASLVDESGFVKCSVDLFSSWDPTKEELSVLDSLEEDFG